MLSLKEAVTQTLDALRLRQRAYYRVLRSPDAAVFFADMAKFCRAHEPCWGATPEDTARLIGRNEVWHRMMQHLQKTPEELYEIYGGKYPIHQLSQDDNE